MSATGQPAYSELLLFKMSLLQTGYGLSDYEAEDRLNDSISFSKFCDMTMEQVAPDHSTLSRFRSEMTEKGVYDKLLKMLNSRRSKSPPLIPLLFFSAKKLAKKLVAVYFSLKVSALANKCWPKNIRRHLTVSEG